MIHCDWLRLLVPMLVQTKEKQIELLLKWLHAKHRGCLSHCSYCAAFIFMFPSIDTSVMELQLSMVAISVLDCDVV